MEINYLRTRSNIGSYVIALCASARAYAQQSSCTADPTAASCGLDSTAHFLRVAAVILGILLLIIVIAAAAVYQRNRNRKLTPDE